ncbi:MAG TPA: ABC transporter permease [Candidatus Limnocylindrales bacterium]|nr:ABC transporter permease [Candidatus Limnocylindrales bacterium]
MTGVGGAAPRRDEPAFPNTGHIARREYRELVRSRLFHISTIVLVLLAVGVALLPIGVRLIDRGGTTRIVVASTDQSLGNSTKEFLTGLLNTQGSRKYTIDVDTTSTPDQITSAVEDHRVDAGVITTRDEQGRIHFTVQAGETVGDQTIQLLNVGSLAIAVFDFAARNPVNGFLAPDFQTFRTGLGGAGGSGVPYDPTAYASRVIVGVMLGVLIFITIVIYGMWVASGVVAEKSSRVMEMLVGAASPRQLVVGKAVGIGLAGATQVALVLAPAILALFLEEQLATAVLGPTDGVTPSLRALSVPLLAEFALFYTLGFALYALIYAAAGSLVSRPEDLQIIALPLSLIAITGYLQAILALTGGITWFIRFASYIPFWSPFVMMTRLSVGRVEPIELAVSLGLLVATILAVGVIAIRIYGAGVLLYGQRPGFRAYVEAARRG